jgi:cytochrome c6
MRKHLLLIPLLGVMLSVGLAACGDDEDSAAPASSAAPAASTDAAPAAGDPVAGKAVFTANCGACHTLGDAGTTGAVGPNLDELKPDEATVAAKVQSGGGAMPAFGDDGLLDATQIADVAAYVSSAAGG